MIDPFAYDPNDYDLPKFMEGNIEPDLYLDMVGGNHDMADDPILQLAFHEAFFDWDMSPEDKANNREALDLYLQEYYDIELDDVFDWEEYREWYSEQ